MIFLTGDIHHMSMNSSDQKFLKRSEVELAVKYADIAERYGIKVTLFITGKALEYEMDDRLLYYDNVMLGGHTYTAFSPAYRYKIYRLIWGSSYGPAFNLEREVEKTVKAFKKVVGRECITWRTHSLEADPRLLGILSKYGVKTVSDWFDPSDSPRYIKAGIYSLPINIFPDHSNLMHGPITEEFVSLENEVRKKGAFGVLSMSRITVKKKLYFVLREAARSIFRHGSEVKLYSCMQPDEWMIETKRSIEKMVAEKGFASLLIHPACMEILDSMARFEKLCAYISSNYSTFWVSEAKNQMGIMA